MRLSNQHSKRAIAAFTMAELALCIAVVGFAMVAILGVLPSGINVQKENRAETIINQEAQFWFHAITQGNTGVDELTNYVDFVEIETRSTGNADRRDVFMGPFWQASFKDIKFVPPANVYRDGQGLTNGNRIVGLLSTPSSLRSGEPIRGGFRTNTFFASKVKAVVRAITGASSEKPTRDLVAIAGSPGFAGNTSEKLDLAFRYQMQVDIHPSVTFPPAPDGATQNEFQVYSNGVYQVYSQREKNLYDVTLTFEWPVYIAGQVVKTGSNRRVFRTQVAAALRADSTNRWQQTTPYRFLPNQYTANQP